MRRRERAVETVGTAEHCGKGRKGWFHMEKGDEGMTQSINVVRLEGTLHFLKGEQVGENRCGRYFRFSVRHESTDYRGNERHDYILARAYDPELQDRLRQCGEGDRILLEGSVRSSVGSGEMYVLAEKLELP
jgi:hypothetical protein